MKKNHDSFLINIEHGIIIICHNKVMPQRKEGMTSILVIYHKLDKLTKSILSKSVTMFVLYFNFISKSFINVVHVFKYN